MAKPPEQWKVKISCSIDPDLLEILRKRAKASERSLSGLIAYLLKIALKMDN